MSGRSPRSVGAVLPAARAFFTGEEASGIVLVVVAAVAVAWANFAGASYVRVWESLLTVGVAPLVLSKPLLLWINDGLMAVFFFLVGLEIKREGVRGELASVRGALLPVVAAVGGMVVPATIYAMLNADGPGARGWGVPMATDIAFALGVLALLGDRVTPSLRVFLTAVAIADDVGAVVVIALFYTADLQWAALGVAGALVGVLAVVNRAGAQSAALYVVLGIALWVAVLKSGIHATVAGVALAFTIPASTRSSRSDGQRADTRPLLDRLETALEPWVAFGIMPIFALANAGVRLSADFGTSLRDPIALGIILGLFVGKQLGVLASCWALVRLGLATLPSGATWRQLYGVALLCGIGFTMSLFIASLAFDRNGLEQAKIGVLAGSLVSGIAGYLVLAARGNGARSRRGGRKVGSAFQHRHGSVNRTTGKLDRQRDALCADG